MDHFIQLCYHNNQQLTMTVNQNTIRIENLKTLIVYPLDLKTQLKWLIREGQLQGFVIDNKEFYADHSVLAKFKQILGGKITFRSIYDFFTVIQKSGYGAFSSVYNIMPIQGLSQDINQIMVLKRIDKIQVDIQKIHEEIKNLQLCQSKNVVRLVEVYENQLSVFIVMEKLNHIKPVDLIESKVIEYSKEILTAVFNLHKLGIIHRDIKFYNIMVDNDDHIKIIDFGLSCPKKICNEKCGTFGYIAPEVVFKDQYDEKCDMYSVGVLLYQMFNYVFNKQMINIIDFDDKNLYLNIPIQIQQFLQRLLQVNPEKRLSSEQAFYESRQIFEINQTPISNIVSIDQ